MKLKDLINRSYIPAKLIRSVVKQIGGWDEFKERANDVTNHGAAGGFCGFIYYRDTVAFAKRNKKEIIALAKEQDQQIENVGLIRFIAGFNCVDEEDDQIAMAIYSGKGEAVTQIYNALAWYALEEVCRLYSDLAYEGR